MLHKIIAYHHPSLVYLSRLRFAKAKPTLCVGLDMVGQNTIVYLFINKYDKILLGRDSQLQLKLWKKPLNIALLCLYDSWN